MTRAATQQTSSQRRVSFTSLFQRRLSLRAKFIIAFSAIAAVASLTTALAFYTTSQRQLIDGFRRRVLTAAAISGLQQNGDEFETIASVNDPLYEKFRLQNLEILKSDPDFVFVYTMRMDSDGIYFVVDGNELDADGFSAYGDRYFEPSPLLLENFTSMTSPIVEAEVYTDEFGSFLSAYAPIVSSDGRQVGVVGVDITADAIIREQRENVTQSSAIFFAMLVLGIFLGNLAGGTLSRPLSRLAQGARAFASGKFDQRIEIDSQDEIGDLVITFNSMSDEIQNLIGSLEGRVAERTADLEHSRQQSERRARELLSIGEISKLIASEPKMENLLTLITRLVSERFDFYHVGIFLLDTRREYAVLVAANSEGGKRMLERNHRLRVGETGIVGFVTQAGSPRVALDVGLDAVFFNNPDLPDTHSEIALPLRMGPDVFGALDVQSTETNAFGEEDVNILSTLADQVSIAIQNARSYQQSREALSQAEAIAAQMGEQQWNQFIARKPVEGYYFDGVDVKLIEPSNKKRRHSLAIPLTLRGMRIGTLKLSTSESGRTWTEDEIAMAQATAERTALAIENARLLQDAQKRAAKERTIGQISARIGSLVSLENILQTTIQELGNTLPDTDVAIQFTSGSPEKK